MQVAEAQTQVEQLAETKEALSERLMDILMSNETAKLKKLDELGERLQQQFSPEPPPSGSTTAAAAPPPEVEESFEGFDEMSLHAAARSSSG